MKQLLLRGATGVLLATGTVGVAVVTTAAPAHANINCQELEDTFNQDVAEWQDHVNRGLVFKAEGRLQSASDEFGYAEVWYLALSKIQLC